MNCDEARELLDAHSLGALEKSEARQVQKHLAKCPDCGRLHQEAADVSALLALAAPLRRASPALRLRLRQKVAPRPALRGFPAPRLSWATAAAALAVLALGGLTWGGLLQTQVNDLKEDSDRFAVLYDELERRGETVDILQGALTEAAFRQDYLQSLVQEQDQAMRVVALGEQSREDLVGAPASRAKGEYLWSADEGLGVLFLINLPQLSEDSTYQLWLVNDSGDRVSGGAFMPQTDGSARLLVRASELTGTLAGLAVTEEPRGGSETPTGEIVIQGSR